MVRTRDNAKELAQYKNTTEGWQGEGRRCSYLSFQKNAVQAYHGQRGRVHSTYRHIRHTRPSPEVIDEGYGLVSMCMARSGELQELWTKVFDKLITNSDIGKLVLHSYSIVAVSSVTDFQWSTVK